MPTRSSRTRSADEPTARSPSAASNSPSDALLDEPKAGRSAHGLKIAQGGAVKQLRTLQGEIDNMVSARKALPARIRVAETAQRRDVMRLEHKAVVDRIKISAYNAEEWLLDRLVVHYPNPNDVRDLLRSFAELSGTIDTTIEQDDDASTRATGVVVTLDPPDTPIHRRALRGLVGTSTRSGRPSPALTFPSPTRCDCTTPRQRLDARCPEV